MRWRIIATVVFAAILTTGIAMGAEDALPFNHKIEVYRDESGQNVAFSLELEQPFLAEEFEKSNYLRLKPVDRGAFLIYPKETRFHQKHAEFFGRMRGGDNAKVTLSHETVTENLDGTRRVESRDGVIEIPIPKTATGAKSIYQHWAEQQNVYYRDLLTLYPDQTFYQYVLLQSQQRYGVRPAAIPNSVLPAGQVEETLYDVASGALAVHESLQLQTLSGGARRGDLNIPINRLPGPTIASLPYKDLLEARRVKHKGESKRHEIAQLVPENQYFIHFRSLDAATKLLDLSSQWGESLSRLFTISAQDNRVEQKLETQLCLQRDPMMKLFADKAISELAITGSDPFVLEGTDVTLIFRVKEPKLFQVAADGWLAAARKNHPDLAQQQFNYRGHKVAARYTTDRVVSSFVVMHGDYVIYSNSHRAIRAAIDAATGAAPRLYDAADYQYVTSLLPPSDDDKSGYVYASEAFIKGLLSAPEKIAEKRRLECFNNLVMINNASLMYRMEYGKGPRTLNDLSEGRFIDPAKIVCPHGGAYTIDADRDTCACSLHNRLKYLTPNCELPVYTVSSDEQAQYERYRQRYEQFWQSLFDPIAARITVSPQVKVELCVLPLANGSLYQSLRSNLAGKAAPIDTAHLASSAIVSIAAAPGRESLKSMIKLLPGVTEALDADPTLADLKWLGDQTSLHFCDAETVLEIDPAKLRAVDLPLVQHVGVDQQAMVAGLLAAATMPTYLTIQVEDRDKAQRLLETMAQRVVRHNTQTLGFPTSFDAYRLPDYKKHAQYVFSVQVYAAKLRLHMALVGNQLVAATKPYILEQVIDAEANPAVEIGPAAQLLIRFNERALKRFKSQLELYWAEKSRLACHRSAISISNLITLYDAPIDEAPKLAEAKYGVRYFCPEHGRFEFDTASDTVRCGIHGNRADSKQNYGLDEKSSFAQFLSTLNELVASVRFEDEALFATVEIIRREEAGK